MKKNRLNIVTLVAVAAVLIYPYIIRRVSYAEENNKESLELKNSYDTIHNNRSSVDTEYMHLIDEHAQLKKDFLKLNNDYQALSADRDNLLIQTKKLIAAKNRTEEMLGMLEQIQGDVEKSRRQKDELAAKNNLLLQRIAVLESAQQQNAAVQKQVLAEKEQLSSSVASLKTQLNSGTLQNEVAELKKTNATLDAGIKQTADENQKLKDSQGRLEKERNELHAKVETLQNKYKEAVKHSRAFEQKLSASPAKLVELANQNRALTDQTATMHYNLGVFYTRQREFSRAAVEFEKAIELKPDDPQAHFNLGYLYAEHIVDRPKATKHFQEYLKYTKKDDKDVDWVKRYLLTWQAWGGKEPIN